MIPTNVTALVGKSAYLSCKVKNLGNKTVSTYAHASYYNCASTNASYIYTNENFHKKNFRFIWWNDKIKKKLMIN